MEPPALKYFTDEIAPYRTFSLFSCLESFLEGLLL